MTLISKFVFTVLLSAPLWLYAEEQEQQKLKPVNSTALMSDEVIHNRLSALGYESVSIAKTSPLSYEITAIKAGKVLLLNFHPQLGTVEVNVASNLMPKGFASNK